MPRKSPIDSLGLFSIDGPQLKSKVKEKSKRNMKEVGQMNRFIAEEKEDALAELHQKKTKSNLVSGYTADTESDDELEELSSFMGPK